jgi:hypothetical protein
MIRIGASSGTEYGDYEESGSEMEQLESRAGFLRWSKSLPNFHREAHHLNGERVSQSVAIDNYD